jgi:hypothetical protein
VTRTPPLKIIPLDNDGLSYQGSEKAPGMSLAEFMSGSWGYTLALSNIGYHLILAVPTPILHRRPPGIDPLPTRPRRAKSPREERACGYAKKAPK